MHLSLGDIRPLWRGFFFTFHDSNFFKKMKSSPSRVCNLSLSLCLSLSIQTNKHLNDTCISSSLARNTQHCAINTWVKVESGEKQKWFGRVIYFTLLDFDFFFIQKKKRFFLFMKDVREREMCSHLAIITRVQHFSLSLFLSLSSLTSCVLLFFRFVLFLSLER